MGCFGLLYLVVIYYICYDFFMVEAVEHRPMIEKRGLSWDEASSLTPEEIESLIQAKIKVLYPRGVIRREISREDQCILISDLGLLDEVRPRQVIVADPPPSREELLAQEVRYLAGLERRKGRRPTHRHPI